MLIRGFVFALAFTLTAASAGAAQDFGVMESAEIIQRGNLKFTGYPVLVLGEDGADNELGVVLRGGYGFTERLDGELAVAFYDAATLFGGNIEVALMRAGPVVRGVDLSVRGGLHRVLGDAADATGLDLAALLSTHLTPNLEFVGALDFNQNFFDEPLEDVGTLHLVPGLEYRVGRSLDLLAEVGVGLDEDAANYLSLGLALYLR